MLFAFLSFRNTFNERAVNLDEETEAAIADLIGKMRITRIVVAHRPALIRRATRVVLVKERRIAEMRVPGEGVSDLQSAAA
jgi:ATP-binding cassette subfamily B protein RaxB